MQKKSRLTRNTIFDSVNRIYDLLIKKSFQKRGCVMYIVNATEGTNASLTNNELAEEIAKQV
jgi:hypothetical protein